MSANGRRVWVVAHRWLGLGFGAVLAFMGLTGSVLVYRDAIDQFIHPALRASCEGPDQPLGSLLEAVRSVAPPLAVEAVELPLTGRPALVYLHQEGSPTSLLQVVVDRACARVLALRDFDHTALQVVYRLHGALLAGVTGRYTVAAAGVVLAGSLGSGLVAWWPRRGAPRRWRRALRVKWRGGAVARLLTSHRLAGVAAAPILAAVAVSGIYLALQPELQPLLDAVQPPITPNPGAASAVLVTPDQAVVTALAQLPQGCFTYLEFPGGNVRHYAVWLRQAHEPSLIYARSVVWVDAGDGSVLGVRDALNVSALLATEDWVYPIHDGQLLGAVGRAAWCTIGLLPATLLFTGAWLWWRKPARHQ